MADLKHRAVSAAKASSAMREAYKISPCDPTVRWRYMNALEVAAIARDAYHDAIKSSGLLNDLPQWRIDQ